MRGPVMANKKNHFRRRLRAAVCCCFPSLPFSLSLPPPLDRSSLSARLDGQFVRTTILIQIRSCAETDRERERERESEDPLFSLLFDPCVSRFGDFCVTARPTRYLRKELYEPDPEKEVENNGAGWRVGKKVVTRKVILNLHYHYAHVIRYNGSYSV